MKDQADIVAENEKLTAELNAARASESEARLLIDVTAKERDEARSALAAVTSERDAARTELAAVSKERDELKAKDYDLSKRVAVEVAKHGIRPEALNLSTGNQAAKPFHNDVPPESFLAQNLTLLCRKT